MKNPQIEDLEQNYSLKGKVAIVTGAGRGIGKYIAIYLARLNAHVIIIDVSSSGEEVMKKIEQNNGIAVFFQMDVSSIEGWKKIQTFIKEKYGKVDILINNAIITPLGTTLELPIETWTKTYEVIVKGAILGIKVCLPLMLSQQSGIIISQISTEGFPFVSPYFAMKSALQSLTLSLAAELEEENNVHVYNFGPGMVDTPGFNESVKYFAPKLGMTPEEFALQPLNPGYDGLVPPQDVAIAMIYSIITSKKFHGGIADTFTCMDELKQKFNHTDLIPSNISTSITEQDQQIISGVYLVLKKMEVDYSKSPKIIRGFALREFRKSIGYKLENLILEFKAEKIMNSFKNQERVEKFYLPVTLKLKENIINTRMIIHKWVKGEENIKLAREELINRESILEKFINFFDL